MRKSVSGHWERDQSRFKDTNALKRQRNKNNNASKLCNIVNKIMASKTGEDCAVGSDDEKSDASADNYNIYE